MTISKLFLIHLRRPDRSDENEQRDDPFYEKGSFGCTGCHGSNLLHHRNADRIQGARLAFAQGGPSGTRLVFLTPPIQVVRWQSHCEVRWTPISMPFKYQDAPVLVTNEGNSDFPLLMPLIDEANRSTFEGKFSSCFRTRTAELPKELAKQIIRKYDRLRSSRSKRSSSMIAETYDQALPFPPPKADRNRERTYQDFIAKLDAMASSDSEVKCRPFRRGTLQQKNRC